MKFNLPFIFFALMLLFLRNAWADFSQQNDSLGLVVMPAENYDSYRPGLDSKDGETFTIEDSITGFIGDSYMHANMAAGDGSISNAENINIKLSYNVEFVKTGTHYVWARVFFPSENEDSFFYGIDGAVSGQVSGSPRGTWSWHKGNAIIEVDEAGAHTIDFFGREPNSILDHIIVTSSETFDPEVNTEWIPDPPPDITSQIFVATNGDDENPGTIDEPLESLQQAQSMASPGDTIYIRGGIYNIREDQISRVENNLFACITYLDKSGLPGQTIKYWAYPGETPIFDFSAVTPANQRVVGIWVSGSYIHIKGLEMTGVQVTIKTHTESYCIYSRGNNNIFEEISMHDNVGTGLRHFRGGGNLFLNCDAYRNHDNVSEDGLGSNSDGFGCHPDPGSTGNVFKGCRAWFNSDDGFDIIRADEAVVFDSCWAFYNGYSTSFSSLGDGNGFKAGGYAYDAPDKLPNPVPRNTIRFCIAVRNKANGFYSNHHLAGNDWYNNSAYQNSTNFNIANRESPESDDIWVNGYDHVLKNNLSYQTGLPFKHTAYMDTSQNIQQNNSFDLPVSVSADDFVSIDKEQLIAPRKTDGNLPDIDFMRPAPGSDIIDAGIDIGFSYMGDAPDLGAFEFDPATSIANTRQITPDKITLSNNYPNPFNPQTNFRFMLSESGYVDIAIYNLLGQKISTLATQNMAAGTYNMSWNGTNAYDELVRSGVYFYRLTVSTESGRQILQKKMILLK